MVVGKKIMDAWTDWAKTIKTHTLEKLRKDKEASDSQLQAFLGYVSRYIQATRPKGPRAVRTSKSYFRNRTGSSRIDEAGDFT